MKHAIFLFVLSALLSFSSHAQVKDGDPAPRLDLQAILQGGSGASVDKLGSKFVLLEFWATWCTPCVRNIPHLNELQEKFKKKNIQFISVTDETKDHIELFLKKRKMNGWVGIDNNGHTFKSYGIEGRPVTVIINNKGTIVYRGEPTHVTAELLNKILAGNAHAAGTVSKEEKETDKLGGFSGGEDPVVTGNFDMGKMGYLHQEVIRPTVNPGGGYAGRSYKGSIGISIIGADINQVIAYMTDLPTRLRVLNLSSVPDTASWDIIFSRSKGYNMDKAMKELHDLVCRTFSIAIRDTEVVKEILVPQVTTKKLIKVADVKDDDPQIKTYQVLSSVYCSVERKMNKIVYYGADADEVYLDVFELGNKYYSMSGAELVAWLEKQGIGFTPGTKRVKLTAVYDVK